MSDLRVPDLNNVVIAGRLTRDPELKYISSGRAVCKVTIANSRFYKDKNGERKEDTSFVDATVWDKMAEFVGERLKKGRPVIVEGRLKSDSWEDKATGQKRTKIEIAAQRISPLDWDENSRGGSGGGGNYGGGGGGYGGESNRPSSSSAPAPREIEEPIPEDDIPF
jgi:single-strand DNA-binding protein